MGSSDSSSAQYIHMVHHLIEECIIFKMSKEECMEALSRHANIKPVITFTVWKELEKENKEFFEAYTNRREEKVRKIKSTSSSSSSRMNIWLMMRVKAETMILEGDPKEKICVAADQLHADLLVVGSRGLGAIKRVLLGSVSNYCAHHVPCPVLIVKPPTKVAHS